MNSAVCTLFEGHYHYGVAGLTNSLYQNGYTGIIYAGFKGKLPFWAKGSKQVNILQYVGYEKVVTDNLRIVFILLETSYHLTNFKPDFLLDICTYLNGNLDSIFYFDPDIILSAPWSFMIDWVNCGVAVSEDVNSPLQEFHPKRCYWREYYAERKLHLRFKNSIYVNGGFIAVQKKDFHFIEIWKTVQELMSPAIGGLHKSIFNVTEPDKIHIGNDYAPFGRTDQDALNIAVEIYEKPISFGGKEVMGIISGLTLIPHALGSIKPWKLKPLTNFLKGNKSKMIDRIFWKQYSTTPINCFGTFKVLYMNYTIKLTAFLSRFYSK